MTAADVLTEVVRSVAVPSGRSVER
jgi:hypothetical protein